LKRAPLSIENFELLADAYEVVIVALGRELYKFNPEQSYQPFVEQFKILYNEFLYIHSSFRSRNLQHGELEPRLALYSKLVYVSYYRSAARVLNLMVSIREADFNHLKLYYLDKYDKHHHQLDEYHKSSEMFYKEALSLVDELPKTDSLRLAVYHSVSRFYLHIQQSDKAKTLLEDALELHKQPRESPFSLITQKIIVKLQYRWEQCSGENFPFSKMIIWPGCGELVPQPPSIPTRDGLANETGEKVLFSLYGGGYLSALFKGKEWEDTIIDGDEPAFPNLKSNKFSVVIQVNKPAIFSDTLISIGYTVARIQRFEGRKCKSVHMGHWDRG
jgi:hypothetical protein